MRPGLGCTERPPACWGAVCPLGQSLGVLPCKTEVSSSVLPFFLLWSCPEDDVNHRRDAESGPKGTWGLKGTPFLAERTLTSMFQDTWLPLSATICHHVA